MTKLDIKNAALKFKGWPLYKLAIEMDISNNPLYSYQNGKTKPNTSTLIRIAHVLDCTVGDLFVEV